MEKDPMSSLTKELNLSKDFPPPTYDDWKAAAEKLLKGAPFDKVLLNKTYEGITLNPIYQQKDIENLDFVNSLPGFAPYVRGNHILGYREKSWEVSQELSVADPAEFNLILKNNLQRGQTEINCLVTGSNSCTCGLQIKDVNSFAVAFKDIDLEKYPLRVKPLDNQLMILELLQKYITTSGLKVKGAFIFDPLADLLISGKASRFPADYLKKTLSLTRGTNLRVISVEGNTYKNAGSSITQELAFAFSTAIEYIRNLKDKLESEEINTLFDFTLSVDSDFFFEIAKFRAARMIWTQILQEFGLESETKMYIHARTTTYNKTVYDPYVNLLRTTTEAFSAVLGNVDSLHVGYFDEALKSADDFSRRIARNQQLILKEEASLDRVADPVGGAWYIEYLTNFLAEKTWELIQEIENKGGMLEAIKKGFIQTRIAEIAEQKQKNYATRKDAILGTNYFTNIGEVLPEKEDHCCCCETSCDSSVIAVSPLKIVRAAFQFEQIRDVAEKFTMEKGIRPKVFIAIIGDKEQLKLRMDFSEEFMKVGGFDVVNGNPFADSKEAAIDAHKSGADIIVICSSDSAYPEIIPLFTTELADLGNKSILLMAGYLKDYINDFTAAGVFDFIHLRADAVQIFNGIWEKLVGNRVEDYLNNYCCGGKNA